MASVEILFQGLVEGHDHETAFKDMLNAEGVDRYLVSVAFARKSGVDILAECLDKVKDKIQFFVGIRNGVTSSQALIKLIELGIHPYIVDMASSKRIYHPKVYAAYKNDSVKVILGSANLTFSGMNENVEASTILTLDPLDRTDNSYILTLENTIRNLSENFPTHVFQVSSVDEVQGLLLDGRLEDESIKVVRAIGQRKDEASGPILPAMPILTRRKRLVSTPLKSGSVDISPESNVVWKVANLVERDLCIPKGTNTNPTGSVGIKKGLLENIDHRHHFRDVVFNDLNWEFDTATSKTHIERACAIFEIIIDGISFGGYTLGLSHNTLTDTQTYRQKNTMTNLHWGDAKFLVAKREHLGKNMTLYKIDSNKFQLVID